MLPTTLIGCSSKSYFSAASARRWADVVANGLREEPLSGEGVFLCVSHPLMPLVEARLTAVGALVGVQDVSVHPPGAFTGEVSAELLAELGVSLVMVGHPERFRHAKETTADVRARVRVTVEAGMTPILIAGEPERGADPEAVIYAQLEAAFADIPLSADVVVAYEPTWAIGQAEPAPASHVLAVVERLRELVAARSGQTRLLYGGSAGPGTFAAIAAEAESLGRPYGVPDGVFLGRGGLDPASFLATVHEVRAAMLPRRQVGRSGA